MSPNRRIVLNIVATYGRSLYALALGIFTARWALLSLGEIDYGLFGLVGGLTSFISFINGLMSFAIGRYYGVSVGMTLIEGQKNEGIDECRKWFNIALTLHTVIPLSLLLIGYPIGEWAIRFFLAIPAERMGACVWVWRFTCVSCFVGMASVPFCAMYSAKQDIVELTIYGFVTSTLNACFLYYMITHEGDWLVKYSLWVCVVAIAPQIIQIVRAVYKYSECRFIKEYLWDTGRILEILKFSAARFWTMLSALVNRQGDAILVNKFLGPAYNASMALANSAASHTTTLASALTGAFWPAIMNLAGKGDVDGVKEMSYRMCRFGALLAMIFALPLMLELPYVLKLWLKSPPPFVAPICFAILIDIIFERMSEGLYMPIMSLGIGVGKYSWFIGWGSFSHFALACILFLCGVGMWTICIVYIITRIIIIGLRLYLAKSLTSMDIGKWFGVVFIPILSLCVVTLLVGAISKILPQTFTRLVISIALCELTLFAGGWYAVLNNAERDYVSNLLMKRFKSLRCS